MIKKEFWAELFEMKGAREALNIFCNEDEAVLLLLKRAVLNMLMLSSIHRMEICF